MPWLLCCLPQALSPARDRVRSGAGGKPSALHPGRAPRTAPGSTLIRKVCCSPAAAPNSSTAARQCTSAAAHCFLAAHPAHRPPSSPSPLYILPPAPPSQWTTLAGPKPRRHSSSDTASTPNGGGVPRPAGLMPRPAPLGLFCFVSGEFTDVALDRAPCPPPPYPAAHAAVGVARNARRADTGNESPVEEYINNTGLMWELGESLSALLVFAEHRYELALRQPLQLALGAKRLAAHKAPRCSRAGCSCRRR